jgi:ketosteroid isomerase-like protein
MTMSANRQLLDRYVELYNRGDLDGVMDLYAEDAVQYMPDGTFEGRSTIRERLALELNGFPDVTHTPCGASSTSVTHSQTSGPSRRRTNLYDNMAVATQLGFVPDGAAPPAPVAAAQT